MEITATNRLQHFPIMMFAIVMGMSGLTITYQKAAVWLGISDLFGTVFMYATTLTFIVVSLIYLTKYIKYKTSVKNEFSHPVRINFFAEVSKEIISPFFSLFV